MRARAPNIRILPARSGDVGMERQRYPRNITPIPMVTHLPYPILSASIPPNNGMKYTPARKIE